jgi:hypothetical protein
MHVDRWLSAVDLAATLMLEHGDYQRRRRGGRRAHAAAVHTRLDGVNAVQLTAGLAWIFLAYRLLPSRPQQRA